MIERLPGEKFAYLAATPDGSPPMLSRERAVLPCGCFAAVGMRTDTKEAAMGASTCSPEHTPMMEDFMRRYGASLVAPTSRPAVEVANDLLTVAAKLHGVRL